ncbi:MAG: hypothetical protein CMJ90_09070 [Planctomycetes bacterium]|nr:hypothetical protein [Planctomycetota bacterium]
MHELHWLRESSPEVGLQAAGSDVPPELRQRHDGVLGSDTDAVELRLEIEDVGRQQEIEGGQGPRAVGVAVAVHDHEEVE